MQFHIVYAECVNVMFFVFVAVLLTVDTNLCLKVHLEVHTLLYLDC